jgi:hypothetical protein
MGSGAGSPIVIAVAMSTYPRQEAAGRSPCPALQDRTKIIGSGFWRMTMVVTAATANMRAAPVFARRRPHASK